MSKLQQRLMRELQQNRNIKIVKTAEWCIPIRTVEVMYEPVRRSTMDVLMTMLLISIQEADFESTLELSELLLVDPLFIEDLVSLMVRVNLMKKEDNYYSLTEKGQLQLEQGIFEEELEIEKTTLYFSPCHQSFLTIDADNREEYDDLPELYRYIDKKAEQQEQFEESLVIAALQEENEEEVGNSQKVITKIVQTEAQQINDSPCLEFVLYDKEQDILFVRVWNTFLNRWDHYLEQQLTDKEQLTWREQYLS
ncbi:hypothetical protein U1P98_02685 [Lysinibacillus irui]|uniref:Uncharacterized protein n=1 Tax=Lysinibacillus irui TaxID=2998077 RepID=A0AAJ5RKC0_9BACI|nr:MULTISPECIES: hypothetical protein [Lysinibacillus]MEA0553866.1 hypothetical protein [Lysinibacillus irui]MEA0562062.1 hypothetical protein [Lysinibacillus irui]MEA0975192.1 hypothetical protein [Lysinibacillus irui]MEA1041346.1 hypothetical protein [Lysinibacillus irui]WDV07276.1 hypothetical protein OU989_02000 [Lysinibacillus irui]